MADTNQLIHDLSKTEGHTAELEKDTSNLENDLKTIDKDLSLSKTVNSKLHELNDALNTASGLLTVVSIIPEIGAEASEAKKIIDTFNEPIKKAREASDKVEKIVKPIRDKVEASEKKVEQVDEALLKTMNVENSMITYIGNAQNCITSLPNGDIKSTLSNELDKISSTIDPIVLKFDDVQVKTLDIINKIDNEVDSVLSWCRSLVDISKGIDAVMNTLHPLISALQKVESALSQTIRVPYGGYPKICHKHVLGVKVPYPCGWHTVYFSFTIKQILNGVTGVIEPVMKLLNEAMDKVLSPLLKALNLKIHLPSIPGLDDLTSLADKLEKTIDDIEDEFTKVFSIIDEAKTYYEEIESYEKKIEDIYNECTKNEKA